MIDLFNDGGWAMYPLLFLLIAGIAVAVERAYNLTRARIDADAFFGGLERSLKESGPQKAAELCAVTPGPVASVITPVCSDCTAVSTTSKKQLRMPVPWRWRFWKGVWSGSRPSPTWRR